MPILPLSSSWLCKITTQLTSKTLNTCWSHAHRPTYIIASICCIWPRISGEGIVYVYMYISAGSVIIWVCLWHCILVSDCLKYRLKCWNVFLKLNHFLAGSVIYLIAFFVLFFVTISERVEMKAISNQGSLTASKTGSVMVYKCIYDAVSYPVES